MYVVSCSMASVFSLASPGMVQHPAREAKICGLSWCEFVARRTSFSSSGKLRVHGRVVAASIAEIVEILRYGWTLHTGG